MRHFLARRSGRLTLVSALFGVMALGATTVALAIYPDGNVTHYAACLNTSGQSAGTFSQVAVGDDPAKECGKNQETVHLSGGDITKVTAGTGLTGGGDNGAVIVGLDPAYSLPQNCGIGSFPDWGGASWECFGVDNTMNIDIGNKSIGVASTYQLPQACTAGQIPTSNGPTIGWSCGDQQTYSGTDFALSNQACPPGQFAFGVDLSGSVQCSETPRTPNDVDVGTLFSGTPINTDTRRTSVINGSLMVLPAGNWLLEAHMLIENDDSDPQETVCNFANNTVPGPIGSPGVNTIGGKGHGDVDLLAPLTVPNSGPYVIHIECSIFNGGVTGVSTASQVGTFH